MHAAVAFHVRLRVAAPETCQEALTVGTLQLGHGGHEGTLGHVALHWWHEWLLVGRVQRLGELYWLQGGQAAAHAVDDRHTLRLCGSQACNKRAGSQLGLPAAPLAGTTPSCQNPGVDRRGQNNPKTAQH